MRRKYAAHIIIALFLEASAKRRRESEGDIPQAGFGACGSNVSPSLTSASGVATFTAFTPK